MGCPGTVILTPGLAAELQHKAELYGNVHIGMQMRPEQLISVAQHASKPARTNREPWEQSNSVTVAKGWKMRVIAPDIDFDEVTHIVIEGYKYHVQDWRCCTGIVCLELVERVVCPCVAC